MLEISDFLENLDPRSKIISFLAIIFCIILTPITRFKDFGLYFLLILGISFLSSITPRQVLKRIRILIPFVLFMAMLVPFVKDGVVCWSMKMGYWKWEITSGGVWTFLNIVVKSGLIFLLLIIDNATIIRIFHGEMRSAEDFRISLLDFLFIAGIIASLLCIVSGFVYKIEFMKAENVHVWHGL
ncbi:MAG: hypothetical protein CV087_18650 [Candidatus Brocadia sp. WS118]|nr:MAG: hypothetical protein CV087_18650 [Candidatus Brocadia sp. WS118]